MLDIYWNLVMPLAIILVFNIALFVLIKVKIIQRLKLTKNLIVVLLVVTLVPVICIVFVNEKKISSVLYTETCEKLRSVGKTRTVFLNERLEEVRIDTETIAQNWIVIEVLRQIGIEKTSKADPNFNALYKNAQGHLNRIVSIKGYEDIMLVSAEGKIEVTGAKHEEEVGLDVSAEIYFRQGKEKTYFTDLFYNKFADKNLMYVITPCCDLQGRFIGCVIVEVGLKRIYDVLVDREGLGESGETYIGIKRSSWSLNPDF